MNKPTAAPDFQLPLTVVDRPIAQARPDDFDWSAGNPDLVIPEQPATAVYENPFGSIVIRQEDRSLEGNDPFICIHPDNLGALIDRLHTFLPRCAR
jgi:hypothetical protein